MCVPQNIYWTFEVHICVSSDRSNVNVLHQACNLVSGYNWYISSKPPKHWAGQCDALIFFPINVLYSICSTHDMECSHVPLPASTEHVNFECKYERDSRRRAYTLRTTRCYSIYEIRSNFIQWSVARHGSMKCADVCDRRTALPGTRLLDCDM